MLEELNDPNDRPQPGLVSQLSFAGRLAGETQSICLYAIQFREGTLLVQVAGGQPSPELLTERERASADGAAHAVTQPRGRAGDRFAAFEPDLVRAARRGIFRADQPDLGDGRSDPQAKPRHAGQARRRRHGGLFLSGSRQQLCLERARRGARHPRGDAASEQGVAAAQGLVHRAVHEHRRRRGTAMGRPAGLARATGLHDAGRHLEPCRAAFGLCQ